MTVGWNGTYFAQVSGVHLQAHSVKVSGEFPHSRFDQIAAGLTRTLPTRDRLLGSLAERWPCTEAP